MVAEARPRGQGARRIRAAVAATLLWVAACGEEAPPRPVPPALRPPPGATFVRDAVIIEDPTAALAPVRADAPPGGAPIPLEGGARILVPLAWFPGQRFAVTRGAHRSMLAAPFTPRLYPVLTAAAAEGPAPRVALSDGQAAVADGGAVRRFELPSGRVLAQTPLPDAATALAFAGDALLVATRAGALMRISADGGVSRAQVGGVGPGDGEITALLPVPGGVVARVDGRRARLVRISEDGREAGRWAPDGGAGGVLLGPALAGATLCVARSGPGGEAWGLSAADLAPRWRAALPGGDGPPGLAAPSADGQRCAVAGSAGAVAVLDAASGAVLQEITGAEAPSSLTLRPRGLALLAGGALQVLGPDLTRRFTAPVPSARRVAASADGRYVAVLAADARGSVLLFDLDVPGIPGQQPISRHDAAGPVADTLEMSPDGRWLGLTEPGRGATILR